MPTPESAVDSPLAAYLSPPRSPDELGSLGDYRVIKLLGHGGMGYVFLAEDGRLERQVALKVMAPDQAKSDVAHQRFLREARMAARVKHENVVTIYEVNEINGLPFIAMERLKGLALDRWCAKNGSPPLPSVLRISREMLAGLNAAHAHGMVHRDIKPANIWLENPNGKVRLLDFGLAVQPGGETNITASGALIGTPSYMSPEQARGEALDGRSDLFSVGIVMYLMTTGRLPFSGATPLAVVMNIANTTPTPVSELNPTVPKSLEAVIHHLLEKNANDRPATAKAAIAELAGMTGTFPALGTPSRVSTPSAGTATFHTTPPVEDDLLPVNEPYYSPQPEFVPVSVPTATDWGVGASPPTPPDGIPTAAYVPPAVPLMATRAKAVPIDEPVMEPAQVSQRKSAAGRTTFLIAIAVIAVLAVGAGGFWMLFKESNQGLATSSHSVPATSQIHPISKKGGASVPPASPIPNEKSIAAVPEPKPVSSTALIDSVVYNDIHYKLVEAVWNGTRLDFSVLATNRIAERNLVFGGNTSNSSITTDDGNLYRDFVTIIGRKHQADALSFVPATKDVAVRIGLSFQGVEASAKLIRSLRFHADGAIQEFRNIPITRVAVTPPVSPPVVPPKTATPVPEKGTLVLKFERKAWLADWAGLKILIDNELKFTTRGNTTPADIPLKLDPGKYTLAIQKNDVTVHSQSVTVTAGQPDSSYELSFEIYGSVKVPSPKGLRAGVVAKVYIDGSYREDWTVGSFFCTVDKVVVGKHTVEVRVGLQTFPLGTVTVEPGKTVTSQSLPAN